MSEIVIPMFDGEATDQLALRWATLLMRLHRPRIVVEAGTYRGHFAILAAATMRDLGIDGHVYTADPYDYGVAAFIEANNLRSYITSHQGDFEELFDRHPEIVEHIDFAYIDSGPGVALGSDGTIIGREIVETLDDGGPDPRFTSMRWRHYLKARINLAENGIIVVDDTNATNADWDQVEAIKDQASLVLTGARGLTVYQQGRL